MVKNKILAFHGKKGSGKNTFCNFMTGFCLAGNGIVESFDLHDGKLYIEQGETKGILDLEKVKDTYEGGEFAARSIWPYAKIYAFAEPLKEICVELFNCPRHLVYGSDEDKNTVMSHLLWENMPGVVCCDSSNWMSILGSDYTEKDVNKVLRGLDLTFHTEGAMTIRQFLQFMGTEVMRKIWGPVWVNALIKKVQEEESDMSLVSDLRFDNEAEGLKNSDNDVKIIKLTRSISEDGHISEQYIDDKHIDAVIDNANLNVAQSCELIVKHLRDWGWAVEK